MGRLMLWAIPRSKSTIVLKSLTSNPQVKGIFEPFAFANFAEFYDNQFTYQQLAELIKKEPFTCDNIVWKDIAGFVENEDYSKWITDKTFKHALLIRHPKQVCLSQIGVDGKLVRFMNFTDTISKHPSMMEIFNSMLRLHNYLDSNGFEYKVFDSSNLCDENCEEFIKSLCDFGEIPFDKECMMNMPKTDRLPCSWWLPKTADKLGDNPHAVLDFHSTALHSTRFKPKQQQATGVGNEMDSTDGDKLQSILKETLPIYDFLLTNKTKSSVN